MADTLLLKFGEPIDLKAVIDYQPNETDPTYKSLMNFSIEEFIPPKPGENIPTDQLFENLLTYLKFFCSAQNSF